MSQTSGRTRSCVAPLTLLLLAGLALAACPGESAQTVAPGPVAPASLTESPLAERTSALDFSYPLEWCPVSRQPLGSMGEPLVYDHDGRELRFCCESCIEPFTAEPERYLAAVDAAIIERQLPGYPLERCVVLGEPLGSMGEPLDIVYRNRLVRLCCAGCVDAFRADPERHLAALAAGRSSE